MERSIAISITLAMTLVALALDARAVRADAIGPCPPGQHVVVFPVPEGARHHNGFHCEPDPTAPEPTTPTTAEPTPAPETTTETTAAPAASTPPAAESSGCAVGHARGSVATMAIVVGALAIVASRRARRRRS